MGGSYTKELKVSIVIWGIKSLGHLNLLSHDMRNAEYVTWTLQKKEQ